MRSIADLRKEYTLRGLSEDEVDPDPIRQFARWFAQATAAGLVEPNAMTLATVGPEGQPSARVVLLKDFDTRGFVFFSNYLSRKGRELEVNPRAALVFYWPELERQVRVEGIAARVDPAESDAYFASRPVGSRIGAWASPQSSVIDGRESLERAVEHLTRQFGDGTIPRPPHWGGYRVAPSTIEFWQGRPNRLHDRLRYRQDTRGAWIIERLAP